MESGAGCSRCLTCKQSSGSSRPAADRVWRPAGSGRNHHSPVPHCTSPICIALADSPGAWQRDLALTVSRLRIRRRPPPRSRRSRRLCVPLPRMRKTLGRKLRHALVGRFQSPRSRRPRRPPALGRCAARSHIGRRGTLELSAMRVRRAHVHREDADRHGLPVRQLRSRNDVCGFAAIG